MSNVKLILEDKIKHLQESIRAEMTEIFHARTIVKARKTNIKMYEGAIHSMLQTLGLPEFSVPPVPPKQELPKTSTLTEEDLKEQVKNLAELSA